MGIEGPNKIVDINQKKIESAINSLIVQLKRPRLTNHSRQKFINQCQSSLTALVGKEKAVDLVIEAINNAGE